MDVLERFERVAGPEDRELLGWFFSLAGDGPGSQELASRGFPDDRRPGCSLDANDCCSECGEHFSGPHAVGCPVGAELDESHDECDGADRPAEQPVLEAAAPEVVAGEVVDGPGSTRALWMVYGYVNEDTGETDIHVYPAEKIEEAEGLHLVYVGANLDAEITRVDPARYVEMRDKVWEQVPLAVFHDHCGPEVIELRKPVGA